MGGPSEVSGKVVLVPFPFDDLSGAKLRPAVCLTEPIGPNRHIALAFITSQEVQPLLATDISLSPRHPDFSSTGLRVESVLRLHRLVTLSAGIIQRELGRLSGPKWDEVEAKLRALFGLWPGEIGASHEQLWKLAHSLPTDFEPYGKRSRDDGGADCSCGCQYFHPLEGARGADWGICTNPKSPRAGLLTFEHMGCKDFEGGAAP